MRSLIRLGMSISPRVQYDYNTNTVILCKICIQPGDHPRRSPSTRQGMPARMCAWQQTQGIHVRPVQQGTGFAGQRERAG